MGDCDRFIKEFVPFVRAYGGCRRDPSRDPCRNMKDRPWWPMRYFLEDDILAAWVYRIRDRSRCEVGLFLAEDHYKYVKDSGAKGGLIFLLTQTFHLLGKMEVNFVGPRAGQTATLNTGFEPQIPETVRRVAKAHGVELGNKSCITDEEGRTLYARLTGFSDETIGEFRKRGIDLTQACFVVQRDIWSFDQVEYLLRNAPEPERLFNGGVSPADRLSVLLDQVVLRTAILEERLRIVVEQFTGEPKHVQAEWVGENRVRYTSDRDLGLPIFGGAVHPIKARTPFEVTITPRNAQGYVMFAAEDARRPRKHGDQQFIGVTRDIEWTGLTPKEGASAPYLPVFDTLTELDSELDLRLAQAVSTRCELSERHD